MLLPAEITFTLVRTSIFRLTTGKKNDSVWPWIMRNADCGCSLVTLKKIYFTSSIKPRFSFLQLRTYSWSWCRYFYSDERKDKNNYQVLCSEHRRKRWASFQPIFLLLLLLFWTHNMHYIDSKFRLKKLHCEFLFSTQTHLKT